ncbi:MAG: recombinase family protein [Armatimonadetes bacterium]|nr:recombinase family protein [Armatimonadota bacterium]
MAIIGYARISTSDQSTDLQTDALRAAGCSKLFSDQMSGARHDRPGLQQALDYVREGDTLVVWRLDRLGRSLSHLISVVEQLQRRGVELKSLTEQIDTNTSSGKLVYSILACLADYERTLIRERVNAGLAAARKRGRIGGRPKVVDAAKARSIRAMRAQGMTTSEILESAQISRATLFRFYKDEEERKQRRGAQ